MNKGAGKRPLPKENVNQAVVLANSYNKNFSPVCHNVNFLPLVNKKVIDYTMEWLSMSGIHEVILFVSTSLNEVKEFVENKTWFGLTVKVFSADGCCSVGDVMRVLDRLAIIRNNFVLLTADTVGNINFIPLLHKFKEIQNSDKGASMMIIYKEIGKDRSDIKSDSTIVYNSSNRVLYHQQHGKHQVKLPLNILLSNSTIDLRTDIINTHVAICSLAIPPLFSDNFDFQIQNDLIKEMLTNEDVLSNTLYCHFLQGTDYVAKITNWPAYQCISRDIIHRWLYPFVPDVCGKYSFRRKFVYIETNVNFRKNCKLGCDIVIGNDTTLENNVYIDESVIGEKCVIGKNTVIQNAFIFNGVKVGENCVIKDCVIGEGCVIKSKCVIDANSLLGPKITLQNDVKVNGLSLVSSVGIKKSKLLTKFNNNSFIFKHTINDSESEDECGGDEIPGLISNKELFLTEKYDSDDTSASIGSSDNESSIADDINIFYNEVVDSLTIGYEEKLKCENLILEINSSRYAYNITVNEVNFHLVKAIFLIKSKPESKIVGSQEFLQQLKMKLNYFMPMLKNYIKNAEAQNDCLLAIEELADADCMLLSVLPNVVNYLYDKDILGEDAILNWYNSQNMISNDARKVLSSFIKWLKEADEESEDSD